MIAISLHQPWASFIISGLKTYETRSWATKVRGRVAIHATRYRDKGAEELFAEFRCLMESLQDRRFDQLPFGAVIGTVSLCDCQRARDVMPSQLEESLGNFGLTRWVWKLVDPKPLRAPIPARGRQGFFQVDLSGAEHVGHNTTADSRSSAPAF